MTQVRASLAVFTVTKIPQLQFWVMLTKKARTQYGACTSCPSHLHDMRLPSCAAAVSTGAQLSPCVGGAAHASPTTVAEPMRAQHRDPKRCLSSGMLLRLGLVHAPTRPAVLPTASCKLHSPADNQSGHHREG